VYCYENAKNVFPGFYSERTSLLNTAFKVPKQLILA
jgi:hypothetical protein